MGEEENGRRGEWERRRMGEEQNGRAGAHEEGGRPGLRSEASIHSFITFNPAILAFSSSRILLFAHSLS
jgi:hypothetical protein